MLDNVAFFISLTWKNFMNEFNMEETQFHRVEACSTILMILIHLSSILWLC